MLHCTASCVGRCHSEQYQHDLLYSTSKVNPSLRVDAGCPGSAVSNLTNEVPSPIEAKGPYSRALFGWCNT